MLCVCVSVWIQFNQEWANSEKVSARTGRLESEKKGQKRERARRFSLELDKKKSVWYSLSNGTVKRHTTEIGLRVRACAGALSLTFFPHTSSFPLTRGFSLTLFEWTHLLSLCFFVALCLPPRVSVCLLCSLYLCLLRFFPPSPSPRHWTHTHFILLLCLLLACVCAVLFSCFLHNLSFRFFCSLRLSVSKSFWSAVSISLSLSFILDVVTNSDAVSGELQRIAVCAVLQANRPPALAVYRKQDGYVYVCRYVLMYACIYTYLQICK